MEQLNGKPPNTVDLLLQLHRQLYDGAMFIVLTTKLSIFISLTMKTSYSTSSHLRRRHLHQPYERALTFITLTMVI